MFYQIIQFLRKVNRSTSDQYLINTQFGSQGENHVRTILEILNKLDNIVQTGECVYIYIQIHNKNNKDNKDDKDDKDDMDNKDNKDTKVYINDLQFIYHERSRNLCKYLHNWFGLQI